MNINSIRTTSAVENALSLHGIGPIASAHGIASHAVSSEAVRSATSEPLPAKVDVDERKLDDMVKKTNESDLAKQNDLQFSVDRDTDVVVVKVVNRSSGEVLRQFPSEEMLDFMQKVDEAAASHEGHGPGLLLQTQG